MTCITLTGSSGVTGVTANFQRETRYLALPHKLKMTISTCDGQCSAPETNCIAFVGIRRKRSDGSEQVGFDLYVGGGLGSSPRAAQSLGVFLQPEDVIETARAVTDLWRDNPENHPVCRTPVRWHAAGDCNWQRAYATGSGQPGAVALDPSSPFTPAGLEEQRLPLGGGVCTGK